MSCNFTNTEKSKNLREVFDGTQIVFSGQQKANVASMVVLPIIMIVALSLSVHFFKHPLGEMVHITPDFSMKLPLLITASTGLGATLAFTVQLARKKARNSWGAIVGNIIKSNDQLKEMINKGLFPHGRSLVESAESYMTSNERSIQEQINKFNSYGGAKIVEMQARNVISPPKKEDKTSVETMSAYVENADVEPPKEPETITLRGIWHYDKRNTRTVVLFHGNGMNAEQMAGMGAVYARNGFNVLLPEIRGYGMSEGQAPCQYPEVGAIYDLEAIHKFLKSQGIGMDTVVAHGYSLGGFYATGLAYFFGAKNVIADHTFSSGGAVYANVGMLLLRQNVEAFRSLNDKGLKCNIVSTDSTYAAAEVSGNSEYEFKAEELQEGQKAAFATSGWNSCNMVKAMKDRVNFLVIQGEEDELMGKIAEDFIPAMGYDKETKKKRLITVEGSHTDISNLFTEDEARHKLEAFLFENCYSSDGSVDFKLNENDSI